MSTETDLPRTIAPSEVRVGDEVEVTETRSAGATSWRFVVADVTDVYGTGPCIVPPENLIGHEGWHSSVFTMPDPLTLTLLDRPTPVLSVLDAAMGTQFQCRDLIDRPYGRWVRTSGTEPAFRSLMGQYADIAADSSSVTRLIPYSAPLSELDTLRQNVIDTAMVYESTGNQTDHDAMWVAVRALRDAESKS